MANVLQRWLEERALDGCNIHVGHPAQFRRFLDDVVPILREWGLLRTEYESDTLRGNLGMPVPENRHTQARRGARPATPDGSAVDTPQPPVPVAT